MMAGIIVWLPEWHAAMRLSGSGYLPGSRWVSWGHRKMAIPDYIWNYVATGIRSIRYPGSAKATAKWTEKMNRKSWLVAATAAIAFLSLSADMGQPRNYPNTHTYQH